MDKEVFEERILALADAMYRVAASILPRQCDREDAIQESILTALQKRERLRDDRALRAWVLRILVNNCYDILRYQQREPSVDILPESMGGWESPDDADLMVRDMLLALPHDYRLVLMLYYAEGYRVREIADILHLPLGTVQSRLHRARKMLKQDIILEKEQSL